MFSGVYGGHQCLGMISDVDPETCNTGATLTVHGKDCPGISGGKRKDGVYLNVLSCNKSLYELAYSWTDAFYLNYLKEPREPHIVADSEQ